jgi:hypothetical protein
VSIDPRLHTADNLGWHPCIPPLLLGRALDRLEQGRGLTLRDRVLKALANLRRRLTR